MEKTIEKQKEKRAIDCKPSSQPQLLVIVSILHIQREQPFYSFYFRHYLNGFPVENMNRTAAHRAIKIVFNYEKGRENATRDLYFLFLFAHTHSHHRQFLASGILYRWIMIKWAQIRFYFLLHLSFRIALFTRLHYCAIKDRAPFKKRIRAQETEVQQRVKLIRVFSKAFHFLFLNEKKNYLWIRYEYAGCENQSINSTPFTT